MIKSLIFEPTFSTMAEVYVISLSYCMGLLTDQNYQGQRVHPHELSVRAPE